MAAFPTTFCVWLTVVFVFSMPLPWTQALPLGGVVIFMGIAATRYLGIAFGVREWREGTRRVVTVVHESR